jgi:hypothetical protein
MQRGRSDFAAPAARGLGSTRGAVMATVVALSLFWPCQQARAGGPMKGGDSVGLLTGAVLLVLGGGVLTLGPSIDMAVRTAHGERASKGWVVTSALTGTVGLGITLGVGLERGGRKQVEIPLFQAFAALSGQCAVYGYTAWFDRERSSWEQYRLAWLTGAPIFLTSFALTEAARGRWLKKKAAGGALVLGALQLTGSALELAYGAEQDRALWLGTAAWGGLLLTHATASLIARKRARDRLQAEPAQHTRRFAPSLAPQLTGGRERSFGLVVTGAF